MDDFGKGGGCIEVVLISGLLLFLFMEFDSHTVFSGSSSITASDMDCSKVFFGDILPGDSAEVRPGSAPTRGNVWLRGRLVLLPIVCCSCPPGLKGFSVVKTADSGLVTLVERDGVVSKDVALCECGYP